MHVTYQVMVAHATLLMQHAQRFAGGLPFVVAGDFNVKPHDACYKVITEGSIPDDHPQSPTHAGPAPWDSAWRPAVSPPLRSAYRDALGREPGFTNFARTKGQEASFCECLDYVFMSPEWTVRDVVGVPETPPEGVESFPTAREPSDHILIGAELLLA
jgi:2',5'-phosphodiesterase